MTGRAHGYDAAALRVAPDGRVVALDRAGSTIEPNGASEARRHESAHPEQRVLGGYRDDHPMLATDWFPDGRLLLAGTTRGGIRANHWVRLLDDRGEPVQTYGDCGTCTLPGQPQQSMSSIAVRAQVDGGAVVAFTQPTAGVKCTRIDAAGVVAATTPAQACAGMWMRVLDLRCRDEVIEVLHRSEDTRHVWASTFDAATCELQSSVQLPIELPTLRHRASGAIGPDGTIACMHMTGRGIAIDAIRPDGSQFARRTMTFDSGHVGDALHSFWLGSVAGIKDDHVRFTVQRTHKPAPIVDGIVRIEERAKREYVDYFVLPLGPGRGRHTPAEQASVAGQVLAHDVSDAARMLATWHMTGLQGIPPIAEDHLDVVRFTSADALL